MAGSLPHYKLGPASYPAGKPVTGGQLVRAAASDESGVVSALQGASVVMNDDVTAATVLGVAATDAGILQYPEGTAQGSTGSADGNVLLDQSVLNYTVAVYNNVDIRVKYSAAASFGALLFADNAGGVTPTAGGTAANDKAVGRCTQPGGVASGAFGRAYIRV